MRYPIRPIVFPVVDPPQDFHPSMPGPPAISGNDQQENDQRE